MEQLLLISGAVVFVVVVALTTRSIVFSSGEGVEERTAGLVSIKADIEATKPPLAIPTVSLSSTPSPLASSPSPTPTPTPTPSCSIAGVPNSDVGPFSSTITATFSNLEAGIADALLKCFATDAGETKSIAGNTASKQCDYPQTIGGLTETNEISATAGSATCTNSVINNPSQTCTLIAVPASSEGPFSSIVTVTFQNLEAGITDALIKCNSTDAGINIPIVASSASRNCDYPFVPATTIFTANASIPGTHPTSCATPITDQKPNLQNEITVCNELYCEINAIPSIYNLIVNTKYASTPPRIAVFDPSISCYNGGAACLKRPCRIRGTQSSDNVCVLIEDWDDYDWNDFIFSANVFNLPDGKQMVSVRNEGCSSAASNELNISFNLPEPKWVKVAETNETKFSENPSFVVWSACQGNKSEVKNYFITDVNELPDNTPPKWTLMSDPSLLKPGMTPANILLSTFISDAQSPFSALSLDVVAQNASVINCYISVDRLVCDAAIAYGKSEVTMAAIDSGGLWATDKVLYRVGPKLSLGNNFPFAIGTNGSIDLWGKTQDLEFPDNLMNYSIIDFPNSTITECGIFNDTATGSSRYLNCTGITEGKTSIIVRVINPNNATDEDHLPVHVF